MTALTAHHRRVPRVPAVRTTWPERLALSAAVALAGAIHRRVARRIAGWEASRDRERHHRGQLHAATREMALGPQHI
ncbi:hypothetical protein [Microbacterium sp. NPDC096154]|uniref:hypothetical protein n=1 Tax=Microbacterium sp. NPDC096154 TaxID=3155549 RepID=UPI00332B926D